VTTEQVAQTIGSVYSTAAKSIAILIEMGVFTRQPNRGSYLLGEVSVGRLQPVEPLPPEVSVGRLEVSGGRLPRSISRTSSKEASRSGEVSDPNGSLTSGASAGKRTRKYDYESEGSDIGVVGRTGPAPSLPERSTRKHDLKVHRTIPREKWDEGFVAKEFRHRMVLERPDIRDVGVDSKSLIRGLQDFRSNYGITVATMATAVDLFLTRVGRRVIGSVRAVQGIRRRACLHVDALLDSSRPIRRQRGVKTPQTQARGVMARPGSQVHVLRFSRPAGKRPVTAGLYRWANRWPGPLWVPAPHAARRVAGEASG